MDDGLGFFSFINRSDLQIVVARLLSCFRDSICGPARCQSPRRDTKAGEGRAWPSQKTAKLFKVSMNSGLGGMEVGNDCSSFFFLLLYFPFLFSKPVVMELKGWMILNGRPVGQSNCVGIHVPMSQASGPI